ncbi:MAG: hypothetical protein ACOX0B_02225 [Minisyncoccales bacterium]|jgi:hypothetical protein
MSYEIIALAIMIFSFLGMIVMVARKIPVIVELPNNPNFISGAQFKEKLGREVRDILKKRYFGIQLFAQKILSKIRIFILRLDNKIFDLNLKLKERSKKTKEDIDFGLNDIRSKLKKK